MSDLRAESDNDLNVSAATEVMGWPVAVRDESGSTIGPYPCVDIAGQCLHMGGIILRRWSPSADWGNAMQVAQKVCQSVAYFEFGKRLKLMIEESEEMELPSDPDALIALVFVVSTPRFVTIAAIEAVRGTK